MFSELPNCSRVNFKDADENLITSAVALWGPLTSTYAGVEVDPSDVKNTALFVVLGMTQRRLATKIILQGHYIWINADENYLITGLKDFGSHTEFVGLRESPALAFEPSTAAGLISEWAFRDSSGLVTDEKGLNNLTNINTVTFDTDIPSQIPFNIGSALFASASSEQLRITDASQVQLDLTGSFTIAFRLKLTTLASTTGIIAKGSTDPNLGYYIYCSTSGIITLELSSDGTVGGRTVILAGSSITTGVWYSVVCTYDGTNGTVYLDGAVATGVNNPRAHSGGQFDNGQTFSLGARSDPTQYLNGRLAHVFVFNQVKSAADIASWHATDVWPS